VEHPLRIGCAVPLSGDQALVGVPMARCAQLALDDARRSGWVRVRVVLELADDRADPQTARRIARRFARDPAVVGVVGHKNSGPTAAAAPIYAAAGLVQVTPSSTRPDLSRRGYRTFFRLCAHDAVQGVAAARVAVDRLGARRLVVVHDGTGYGQPLARAFATGARSAGAVVARVVTISPGGEGSPAIEQIARARPELVFFALTEIDSSSLTRGLRAAGVEAVLLGTDGGADSRFPALAGPAGEGVFHTYAGSVLAGPRAETFARACRQRFGDPPPFGAEVYDATMLVLAALSEVGRPRREAVRRAVARTDREGLTGRIRFDRRGDRRDPQVTLWQVRRGQMVLLDRLA
jgi:branched-chain amino acid transport system substrate-binding protein